MIVDFDLLDDQIFTLLVEYVTENYTESTLTDDNFSTVESDLSARTVLPFIFIHRITGIETALDLERDTLNGGLFTYEIRVTSNDSQYEAKDLMNCVTQAMKSMKFHSTSLPITTDLDNLHVATARWQRRLHGGDII